MDVVAHQATLLHKTLHKSTNQPLEVLVGVLCYLQTQALCLHFQSTLDYNISLLKMTHLNVLILPFLTMSGNDWLVEKMTSMFLLFLTVPEKETIELYERIFDIDGFSGQKLGDR